MKIVRLNAVCDEDERQYVVMLLRQANDGTLDVEFEHFGYVNDFNDDTKDYEMYPFTMAQMDDTRAVLDWGAWDETTTTFDVFGRRLVSGETIVRTELNEKWPYRIKEIQTVS